MFSLCSYKMLALPPHRTQLCLHRSLPSCSHRSHSCKCIISQILSDRILYSGPGFLGLHCLNVCGTRVALRPDITMLPTSNIMITDSSQPKARTKEGSQVASLLPLSLTQRFPETLKWLTHTAHPKLCSNPQVCILSNPPLQDRNARGIFLQFADNKRLSHTGMSDC